MKIGHLNAHQKGCKNPGVCSYTGKIFRCWRNCSVFLETYSGCLETSPYTSNGLSFFCLIVWPNQSKLAMGSLEAGTIVSVCIGPDTKLGCDTLNSGVTFNPLSFCYPLASTT